MPVATTTTSTGTYFSASGFTVTSYTTTQKGQASVKNRRGKYDFTFNVAVTFYRRDRHYHGTTARPYESDFWIETTPLDTNIKTRIITLTGPNADSREPFRTLMEELETELNVLEEMGVLS